MKNRVLAKFLLPLGLVLGLSVSAKAEIGGIITEPGGSNGQVQFNSDGVFGGSSNVSYSTTTQTLTVTAIVAGTATFTTVTLPANSVGGSNIIDSTVTASDLAQDSVGTYHIIDSTITNADISASAAIAISKLATSGSLGSSVIASSIAVNAVSTNTIADGSITAAKMANADHGDISWSGGVATVDNVAAANVAAGSLGASVIASSIAVSGTPDGTKFLRDDMTWVTPSGSGDVILASTQTHTGAKTFNSWTTFNGTTSFNAAATIPNVSGTTQFSSSVTASGHITAFGSVYSENRFLSNNFAAATCSDAQFGFPSVDMGMGRFGITKMGFCSGGSQMLTIDYGASGGAASNFTAGKVGISSSSPVAYLSVVGDAKITSTATVAGQIYGTETSTFSLRVSSGIKILAHGIEWPDGTVQVSSPPAGGGGSGDVLLASTQTHTGAKTFDSWTVQNGSITFNATMTLGDGGSGDNLILNTATVTVPADFGVTIGTTTDGSGRPGFRFYGSNGRVGIGTGSPTANLHISSNNAGGNVYLKIQNENSGGSSQAGIELWPTNAYEGFMYHTGNTFVIGSQDGSQWSARVTNSQILSIHSNGINVSPGGTASSPAIGIGQNGLYQPATNTVGFVANATERMRLTTTGLGISTGTPSGKLHVVDSDDPAVAVIISSINATQANITTADTYISFHSNDGMEGSIAGTGVAGVIAYNTFTGAHWTRLSLDAPEKYLLFPVESSGKALRTAAGKALDGEKGRVLKEQLVRGQICRTRGSNSVMGFYAGRNEKDGKDSVLALGTGLAWVANKGLDVENGDLLMSSDVLGAVEVQDADLATPETERDDVVRRRTIAKARQPIKWRPGEKKRKIAVVYTCG